MTTVKSTDALEWKMSFVLYARKLQDTKSQMKADTLNYSCFPFFIQSGADGIISLVTPFQTSRHNVSAVMSSRFPGDSLLNCLK